ncbi:MAG TPA: hypothetical protein DDX20_07955 [Stenotrophomonas sp.]|nr:hypothetical protein [Stenotrophomonas sp.]
MHVGRGKDLRLRMARGQPGGIGVTFHRSKLEAAQSADVMGQGSAQRAGQYGVATVKRAGLDETSAGQRKVSDRALHQHQVGMLRADGCDGGEGAVMRLLDEGQAGVLCNQFRITMRNGGRRVWPCLLGKWSQHWSSCDTHWAPLMPGWLRAIHGGAGQQAGRE